MKFSRLSILVFSITLVLQSCGPEGDPVYPKATHLYFADYSGKRIGVIDLNSPGTFTTLFDEGDGLDTVAGIALDVAGGWIYAVEELNNRILRMNLDGSGSPEVLYDESDGVSEPTAVAVDPIKNNLYWANSGSGYIMTGTVDGAAVPDTLYTKTKVISYCYGLAVDPTNNLLVFSDLQTYAAIWLGRLDGTGAPTPYFNRGYTLQNPSGVFIDRPTNSVYWADEGLGVISAGSISAQTVRTFFDDEDGIGRADGIAVDRGNGKIYWTEPDLEDGSRAIVRGNLDGTGEPEVILQNVESYNIMLRFDNER
ncbi:MAG TPA: hypothetical protein VD816_17525 [Ohtaekwangia sp.]|nr:hypothetical protein [Ohtaekwangia sp.]